MKRVSRSSQNRCVHEDGIDPSRSESYVARHNLKSRRPVSGPHQLGMRNVP